MDENKDFENQSRESDNPGESYIADPAWDAIKPGAEAVPPSGEPGEESAPQPTPNQEHPPVSPAVKAPQSMELPQAQPIMSSAYQPAPGDGAVQKPSSSKGFIVLIVVAALLVIAIVAVLIFGGLSKKPEEAVRDIFTNTSAQLQELSDQMLQDLPAMRAFMPSNEPFSSDFTIGINSFESGNGLEDEVMSALLKLFELKANTVYDPNAKVVQFDGSLNMGSSPLMDLFCQVSPDQVAFHMPKFSETVLSINPKTLAEDYKNSIFYSEYVDIDSLLENQELLTTQIESMFAFSKMDQYQMQSEMYAILNEVLINAVYEKPVREGNEKVYTVQLDGEQLKNTLVKLLRYIYVDSSIAQVYSDEMRQTLQENIIAPVESLPALPATMVLRAGKNEVLSQMDLDFQIPQQEGDNTLDELRFTYALDENLTQDMVFNMSGSSYGTPITGDLNVKSSYMDSLSDTTISFTVIDEDNYGLDLDMGMQIAAAGDCSLDFSMGFSPESSDRLMDVAMKGTITEENGAQKMVFPSLKIIMGSPDSEYSGYGSVDLNYICEIRPLEQPATVIKETSPIFSMTEDALMAELQKYLYGIQEIVGNFEESANMFMYSSVPAA